MKKITYLDDEIDKLVLPHCLEMRMSNQKADIVILNEKYTHENVNERKDQERKNEYLNRFSTHNQKLFRSLHKETGKFMTENFFDIVGLLDTNRNPNRVDRGFN